ncbi:hypothetical protein Nepgr_026582 [Nepenthes gracilis]|uniref:Sister chromatid cohesion 1 protein 2 n=1 Tax=Nepenthes gracilis TaxID=150966 RepID=A0AAD3T998_NEPGR|nr:hypothetical protein Nepgr_026582 [Nepenthes gracilis]
MFYSHFLLSRKGSLGAIWLAAFSFKRLKKHEVAQTDIPSCVDKILLDEMPSLTYRILAHLLLGVVRIFSKKVEYLFHDCHGIINEMNNFFGKKISSTNATLAPEFSITLPESYELDAFIVEAVDDASGGNVAQCEDIVLQEVWKNDGSGQYLLGKYGEFSVQPGTTTALPSQLSAEAFDQREMCCSVMTHEFAEVEENFIMLHTPPDRVLSPHLMETDGMVTSSGSNSNFLGMGKLRDVRFSQEDFVVFEMMFCQDDIENLGLITASGGAQNANVENGDLIENILSENYAHVAAESKELASTSKSSPGSGVQDARGAQTPEFLVVRTPASKECVKRLAKRKCMHDEIIVLSNKVLRQNIDDASSLVCKRRKAPHTVIDLWRFSRIPNLAKYFLEPLIPCAVLELRNFSYQKRPKNLEPVEITQPPFKPGVTISPRTPPGCKSTIAPETPVLSSLHKRAFGGLRIIDSDAEGSPYSFESARDKQAAYQEELNLNLMDEETDQIEDDGKELYGWSARTRTVARYLHKELMYQKRQNGREVVNLLLILRSRTKKENARLFYEILVLKSGEYLDVMQDKPYDGILVRQTDKMEATLGSC